MKILITGSAGMIGSYVVKELIAKGHTIVGLDRRESDWKHENFIQVVLDLADKKALNDVFENESVDRCIHLAALAHFAGENDLSFERFKFVNVTCAENVFEACALHSVPVLFISTVDAIGEGCDFARNRIEPYFQLRKKQGNGRGTLEGNLPEMEYLSILTGIYENSKARYREAILPEIS